MDSEEIAFVLNNIENLKKENCELRSRLEAVEQSTGALPTSSVTAECTLLRGEQKTNEIAFLCDDDVEPLSKKRLDEIKLSIGATKSTWSDLRQLYPPRQSDFAPLKEFDDDLDVDEAYSQAATMAAYGVELLRIALSCPQIDRSLTRQTSRLLATLCSTLIDTRDQRRHTPSKGLNLKREDRGIHKPTKRHDDSKPRKREARVDSSFSNKRERTYCPEHPSLSSSLGSIPSDTDSLYSDSGCQRPVRRAKRKKRGTPRNNAFKNDVEFTAPIDLAPVPSGEGDNVPEEDAGNDGDTSASDADVEDEPDIILGQGRVMKLHRRVLIRNALMQHGLSEADSIAYFNRWTKVTNNTYNCVWNRWVAWCGKRGLDATKRSEERLTTFISESTKSKSSAMSIRIVARSVWSIIDGTALLKDNAQ
ncbi:hypothetical protein GGI16_001263 [Coemansia sp. S142-1]|nr:hypothetical protein GGI16_001263 [Coemansia sp. S142-1]